MHYLYHFKLLLYVLCYIASPFVLGLGWAWHCTRASIALVNIYNYVLIILLLLYKCIMKLRRIVLHLGIDIIVIIERHY